MSDWEQEGAGSDDSESGEESIDESGLNPTQRRMDEEGDGDRPVDLEELEPRPHEGEEGQEPV